ncbi:hypothetical protein LXL04_011168 [Taraxacum kok-saghyz]
MNGRHQKSDRISALPQDTIEKILTLMPIRDATRTSILSRKWRYSWTTMPKLVFNDTMVVSSGNRKLDRYKFVNGILQVLLLHRGPILELINLSVYNNFREIDQIILHLSRSNNIKKFTLNIRRTDSIYVLPCALSSLQQLEHLDLSNCKIELPLMNKGFNRLKSLTVCKVNISQGFLTNCPLLEKFTWIRVFDDIKLTEREFVSLFKSLPSIQFVHISRLCIEHLAAGSMPHKPPVTLPHLRTLVLSLCFLELSSAVWVISNSPNLEKIRLKMCSEHDLQCSPPIFNKVLDPEDYSGLTLDHLKELKIIGFHNYDIEMEFVKLIMAKSPVLKKTRIDLNSKVSVDEENKMLRDFLLLPFPRTHQEMKGEHTRLDRISALPQDTIEKILTLMPLRDALRTSVLSRKWRYTWTTIPKLVFSDASLGLPVLDEDEEDLSNCKFVNAIFHVLLLHKGPILEFSLSVDDKEISSEIDQMILHLSRSNNNIKKFIYKSHPSIPYYNPPCSFFSLKGLEHIDLSYFTCLHPSRIKGFSMLKSLRFYNGYFTNNMVLYFLSNSPLLEEFIWIKEGLLYLSECELFELFKYVPSVQKMEISQLCIRHLDAGGMPHKLPISLPHLRILVLQVCFLELLTVLCVISSSPNLEKIKIEMCGNHEVRCLVQKSYNCLPDIQDYSSINLDHLKEMEITSFHNYGLEKEFVKLVMAKSPVLKKARIELSTFVSVDEEVLMLRDLVRMPFPRRGGGSNSNGAVNNWRTVMEEKAVIRRCMETEALSLDSLSNLPPNIIQTMLTFLPMRDAFKTSILSRSWRYHCVNMPKLKFDDELFQQPAHNRLSNKCKLLHIVYPILLLHHRPILEFSLSISQLTSCCEIDQIILHLSGNPTLKSFTLCIGSGDDHKLLSSFYLLQQLTHLKLQNCAFQPPPKFYGFNMLTSLYFHNVGITVKVLLRFIFNCPLLKSFTLIEDEQHAIGSWNSDFIELFECLPLIEHLHMSSYPVKCFASGVLPQKLPSALVHLRVLVLSGLCFAKEVELRSALLLITSSPNIEKIKMEMWYSAEVSSMNVLEVENYSYVNLDHLRELEIRNMSNIRPGMDFVKLVLAKSPMLKNVGIVIDSRMKMEGLNPENDIVDSDEDIDSKLSDDEQCNHEEDKEVVCTERTINKYRLPLYLQHSPLDDIISDQSSTMEYCLIKNLAKENPVGKNSSEGKKSAVYS